MRKLLVICGPTAMGKTQAAVNLAKKFNGEIISADSRQMYRGMDIATGKDLEAYGDVPVYMLDVVDPDERYSVAQYSKLARLALEDIWSRGKLPIIVGGTGLYIKAVVDGIQTSVIPPDAQLRKEYENKTASELFEILTKIDWKKANSMNESDRKNPRRLIRAIEIANWNVEMRSANVDNEVGSEIETLMIGLTAPTDILKARINARISRWLKVGAEGEIRRLIASGVPWSAQAMNAIGYRQWKPYFEGNSEKGKVISEWKKEEWQYAKRQMTWFKRDKRIIWFDIESPNWSENVEKQVNEWYNS